MRRGFQSQSAALCATAALLVAVLSGCGGGEMQESSQAAADASASAEGRADALAVAQATARVCFFEHTEYRGASFCVEADSPWVGAAWNDRISSVRVPAGTRVELFFDIDHGGRSLALTGDAPNLVDLNFNDFASSFRVRGGGDSSGASDLTEPRLKDIAMQLVSSAENSSLDWRAQFGYIEDIGDGRGYTAGIIGFCSGTSDMLALVEAYTRRLPNNRLARYLPALRSVNGSDSHAGLDPNYPADWRAAAADAVFQQAQEDERDRVYFNPSVQQAKADGLRALGQFAYYDAIVMHGPGENSVSFGGIRRTAMARARTPAQGGDETAYLNAFLDARVAAMKTEAAHEDTSRVDTAQRVFLRAGNLDLRTPLAWKVYGDSFSIP
jgi:chitosanase